MPDPANNANAKSEASCPVKETGNVRPRKSSRQLKNRGKDQAIPSARTPAELNGKSCPLENLQETANRKAQSRGLHDLTY